MYSAKLRRYFLIASCALASTWCSNAAHALSPDEIALVVNSNVPQGIELAQFYAAQRNIPANRILVLDLPKEDQMPNRQYEDQVVPQVRDFIHSAHLEKKLKCLVTFYGVPLRIDARVNTAEENDELADLRRQLLGMPDQILPSLVAVEGLAKKLNTQFSPEPYNDLEHLMKRRAAAFNAVGYELQQIPAANRQSELAAEFFSLAGPLIGDKATLDIIALKSASHPATNPSDQTALEHGKQLYYQQSQQALVLEAAPNDAAARAKLRQITSQHLGLIQFTNLLKNQADYLDPVDSNAAFDSELAMVEWNTYAHKGFCPNPLFYGAKVEKGSNTYMVSRLDAPLPQIVKSMISSSIKVEQVGLNGQVVIDSLNVKAGEEIPAQAGFGVYDQTMRNLDELLRLHTHLKILFDEKPEVLPPNSATDVALYCGWYSVRHYVPACQFNQGAVGFHVASFELISLRQPGETGWVHGLLDDGVVGTLGAVAEPFLGTFPRADDYFPLLLTGRLTLAEVYWKTCPVVSWMMSCVGDPLYNPYRVNHPLTDADLPIRLRKIFDAPVNP